MICRALSQEQIERIHGASLEILKRVGVVIPHEEMLGRFSDAGACVERKGQRVRIPAELVKQPSRSAPLSRAAARPG